MIWWKSLLVLFAPIIALLLALGLHFEIPELKGFNFAGGILVAHAFTALLIALTLYTAAFIAEIVRAGIQAINRGQSEAAFALGLRPNRTMSLVVLPQALRVIIPPLISQFLNLTKNTSLGVAISYSDLSGTLGGITRNQTGREIECVLPDDADLSVDQPDNLDADEPLQLLRPAEGALRWPKASPARTCFPPSCRRSLNAARSNGCARTCSLRP